MPEMRVVGAAYLTTTASRRGSSPTPTGLDHEVAAEAPERPVAGPPLQPRHHAGDARERVGVAGDGEDAHAPHAPDLPAGGQRPPHPPQAVVPHVDRLPPPAEGT